MDISTKGLIEIMHSEGVCLSPYLDSVGVWTIGVGVTKYDGKDPREIGDISIDQAIALFKDRIKAYTDPIKKIKFDMDSEGRVYSFSQNQFDALASFCYNCGPGNLAKLVKNRSIAQIGEALMLYLTPPEIKGRRQREQDLYKEGKYVANGKVLVFPVSASHKPVYSKGYILDVSKYFTDGPIPEQTIVKKASVPVPQPTAPTPVLPPVVSPAAPAKPVKEPNTVEEVWEWLRRH